MAGDGKARRREQRQARLESALRENLRRRKRQARSRSVAEREGEGEPGATGAARPQGGEKE